MSDPKKSQAELFEPAKLKSFSEQVFSSIRDAMLKVNPFSGTPFEITEEESARFKGRDMELYRWHWQRLEEKGLLPKEWKEQIEKELGDKYTNYKGEIQERIIGLLAGKRALEEWKKRPPETISMTPEQKFADKKIFPPRKEEIQPNGKKDKAAAFHSDMTFRWACRKGDYILWARFQGIFSSPGEEYKIFDLWEIQDGNFITITNRHSDLPPWFDLHPLEVSGSLAYWMMKRLEEGYNPKEPLEGPNLWRVFAGDRIVWVGPNRPEIHSENGVLALVDFGENALVYGEPFDFSDGFPAFGGFDQNETSPEGLSLIRSAWDAVKRLGIPRVAAADDQWRIG